MSMDVSRTSSQDAGKPGAVGEQMLEVLVPKLKVPVKTALHQAVSDGRIHQARLLSAFTDNVDIKDVNGWTPLMLTCNAKKDKIGNRMMAMFLKKGAQVNYKDKMSRTALMIACLSGNESIVRRLLTEDGLDLSAQDTDGNTALMHAAMKKNTAILEMVLNKFLSVLLPVDTRNHLGYTALLLACKHGNFNSAELLLTVGGACPYIRDMEHRYCAKEWINWYCYNEYRRKKEKRRFPHLMNLRAVVMADKQLPEEQSMRKLLRKVYKPTMLKPEPLKRSLSLPVDVDVNKDGDGISDRQRASAYKLRTAIARLEEEHEAERDRLYLQQTGRTSRSRYRDISTAKLRRVAKESPTRKYKRAITLPHIFKLYALSHRERYLSEMKLSGIEVVEGSDLCV